MAIQKVVVQDLTEGAKARIRATQKEATAHENWEQLEDWLNNTYPDNQGYPGWAEFDAAQVEFEQKSIVGGKKYRIFVTNPHASDPIPHNVMVFCE